MLSVILFHFHAHFDLCRARIALLRRLNPELKIFGLYGGDPANVEDARELEKFGIADVYNDITRAPTWNKKNTDLAVANWHRNVGRFVRFDRVHVIQWDLLYFTPVSGVYPGIPSDAIALTGLVPLAQ